ncbi:plasmid mobilization protein [Spirosoma foliorum]|uniref:Bacterial mobilisation domain-containing protein n=1 Tax=Spirosoma foliorum TaxID=2710596 RepID=A0A7G5H2Q7_9BACT|nr:hypothetical protein [Spirosoma foliorum]QMW05399.1 hypothetical protein H3H32_11150 [Spirosoma foliorum]
MARPRKPDALRRDISRLVRFTEAEDKALLARASLAGMNPSEFLRDTALKRRFTPRLPLAEADFLLYVRGEIGRAGNNLNQLMQQLTTANSSTTAYATQTVLDQLQEINQEVLKLLRHGSYSRESQG